MHRYRPSDFVLLAIAAVTGLVMAISLTGPVHAQAPIATPPPSAQDAVEDAVKDEVSPNAADAATDGEEPEAKEEKPKKERKSVERIEREPYDGPKRNVVIVPIKTQIGKPIEYILTRAFRDAEAGTIDTIVLDIDTPGGRLDVTLKILEMIFEFDGHVIAYVNDEAISAGAIISSVCDEIYFDPVGIIGSAGVVNSSGEEIPETFKQKIYSYLGARLRSYIGPEHPYRAEVIRAMMETDYELEVDDEVVNPAGEMLNLTAREAMTLYDDKPLFGSGIVTSIDQLLVDLYGEGNYTTDEFDTNWSEEAAQYFEPIIPVIFGLGMLGLIIELKTPGFGVPGISGIVMILIGFGLSNITGAAGNEPILLFFAGLVLVGLEIFVFTGGFFLGITGATMVLGSLLWVMADKLPGGDFLQVDALIDGSIALGITMMVAIVGLVAFWKFLPRTSLFGHIVLSDAQPHVDRVGGVEASGSSEKPALPDIGTTGVAVTSLAPGGSVEIDGKRYEATSRSGFIERGDSVKVVDYQNYYLVVAN